MNRMATSGSPNSREMVFRRCFAAWKKCAVCFCTETISVGGLFWEFASRPYRQHSSAVHSEISDLSRIACLIAGHLPNILSETRMGEHRGSLSGS